MLPQKSSEIRCLRLAKMHLPYTSFYSLYVYTPLHYTKIDALIIPLQVTFFLLVRIFPLLLLSKFLQVSFFLSWGNIFLELKKFSETIGSLVRYFFHHWL